MPQNDVVVDANVMCLFGTPSARGHGPMFGWLSCCGSLCCSQPLLNEYGRQGSPFVAALIDTLMKEGRFSKIERAWLNSCSTIDGAYNYTCNAPDIQVARNVFRSFRKILVSHDARLRNDVNGFGSVAGMVSRAFPALPVTEMFPRAHCGCTSGAHHQNRGQSALSS